MHVCHDVEFCITRVYSWKQKPAPGGRLDGGSHLCSSIYNAFYAPLLCKRGMMKRISSLRNGNPAAPPPPLPAVISADERCSSAHLGKIPSTPILQKWLTWPFYILCTSFSDGRMDRKTLMKNINYSHSVLLSLAAHPPAVHFYNTFAYFASAAG